MSKASYSAFPCVPRVRSRSTDRLESPGKKTSHHKRHDTTWATAVPYLNQIREVNFQRFRGGLRSPGHPRVSSRGELRDEEVRKALGEQQRENKELRQSVNALERELARLNEEEARQKRKNSAKELAQWEPLLKASQQEIQDALTDAQGYRERLDELCQLRKTLQQDLCEAVKQKNKLIAQKAEIRDRHQLSFQADLDKSKPRQTAVLLSLLWQALLTDPDLDPRFVKRDFLRILKGKKREEIEDILDDYGLGLTKREIKLILARFTNEDVVDSPALVEELRKQQPFPLYEDITSEIEDLRVHFAVMNWQKETFESYFNSQLLNNWRKSKAVKILTKRTVGMSINIAEAVCNYLWKGMDVLENGRVELEDIQEWEVADDVLTRVRLSCALDAINLQDLIDRPVAELSSQLSLTQDQTAVLAALTKDRPLSSLPDIHWKALSEEEISHHFEDLSAKVSCSGMCEIGQRVQCRSDTCVALTEFLSECEKKFEFEITAEQRAAIEQYSFRKTRKVDWLPFTAFTNLVSEFIAKESSGLPNVQHPFDDTSNTSRSGILD